MSSEPLHRRLGSGLLAAAGACLCVALMALDRTTGAGVFGAAAGLVIATAGLLDLASAFDGPPGEPGEPERARALRSIVTPIAALSGALAAFLAAVRLAAAGVLGVAKAACLVPAVFLLLVVAGHRASLALRPRDSTPPPRLVARRGFWVVAGAGVLYLPLLGGFSLIDPWESHYGEVAREMIARDDWISPWWAQGRWFWSKPVLDLWGEALSMRLFGASASPDAVLAATLGSTPRPEWALRMPAFLFATVGLYVLYKGVAAVFGGRAGVLAALALGTMPQFFLMAHQAVTDMPLTGALAAAMGLILLGLASDRREEVRSTPIRVGSRVLHLRVAQLAQGAAALLILAQILYLASRALTIHVGPGSSMQTHLDRFWSGSAGNCDVAGDEPCRLLQPVHPGFPPVLQALVWAAGLGLLLGVIGEERRRGRLSFFGAFVFIALASMAKGPVGVALPACATLGVLVVTGRPRRLLGMAIPSGALLVLLATLPWYVAAYVRHGEPFLGELVFTHMIRRATEHIHDLNGSDDVSFRYYVWQLGYALYGWAGLAPAALIAWSPRALDLDPRSERRRGEARLLALLWFVLSFGLFSVMPTKFHHYILPSLPAVAVLIGVFCDELLDSPTEAVSHRPRGVLAAAAIGGAVLVALIGRDLSRRGVSGEARLLNLVTYNYLRPFPDTVSVRGPLGAFGLVFAVLLLAIAAPRLRRAAVVGFAAAALAFAVFGLDRYLVLVAPHWGQRELVEAYYRARASDGEPLAAFDMNWKGENYYSGNRVAVFPAGGAIKTWIEERRRGGARAFFFLTEHGRVAALRSELADGASVTALTDARLNNKFVLVRASYE